MDKLQDPDSHKSRLIRLHPREYEHPLDNQFLEGLEGTPVLPKLTKKFFELGIEKIQNLEWKGSYLNVTNNNLPKLHGMYLEACKILDFYYIPELYIKQNYSINAAATGVEKPMVMVTTGSVDLLSDEELICILGHELGHIKSGHILYRTMASVLPLIGDQIGDLTLGIGDLVATGIQASLANWSRMSELTCDRAGYLVCQDLKVVISLFMKMAGLPSKYQSKDVYDSFMQQARSFDSSEYFSLDGIYRAVISLNKTHPWTVLRASEILKWDESGQYKSVIERVGNGKNILVDSDDAYCANCGFKLEPGNKFCGGCGIQIQSS